MPVPKVAAPIRSSRAPLAEVAYQYLLEQIGTGSLPAGATIEDKQVASDLDMSPATVRQAIGRLADIGLIDMAANRFTRVAEPSPARFIETIRVAVSLWRLGGRLFLGHYTEEKRQHFGRLVQLVIDGIDTIDDGNLFISRVLDVFDFFVLYSENAVLIETAARLRPVIAHTARLGETAFDLPGTVALMAALDTAVKEANAAALDGALAVVDKLADEFVERHHV